MTSGLAERVVEAALPRLRADDTTTINSQVAFATIPAPTGGEEARASALTSRLRELGLAVERDDVGNVTARVGTATDAPVVVCAHLDTVFPANTPLVPHWSGDRVSCPGIGDNARGLAVLLAVARYLAEHRVHTTRPILLAATVGEEGLGDLRGARHLFTHAGADAHAAIAVDGPGDDRIVTEAIGVHRLQLRMAGPGGHSWTAFDAPNPLHAITRFAARVAELPVRRTPRSSLTITRLCGGEAVNAVPTDATVDVEVRSVDAHVVRTAIRAIEHEAHRALADENARRGPGQPALTLAVATTSERPAGSIAIDHPLVRHCAAATRAIGRRSAFAMASTDANIPMHLGIPAVALGGGGLGGDAHTRLEWFENTDAPLGVARVLATILATAGVA